MWTVITIFAGIVTFLSFAWGMKFHFQGCHNIPARMRFLLVLSAIAFVSFVGFAIWQGVSQLIGIVSFMLLLISCLLFWWAVHTTKDKPPAVACAGDTPTVIYTHGPYAYIRHPFYTAYSLAWIAAALAGGPVQWILSAIIVTWYYKVAREEESALLSSNIGDDYVRYRAKIRSYFFT